MLLNRMNVKYMLLRLYPWLILLFLILQNLGYICDMPVFRYDFSDAVALKIINLSKWCLKQQVSKMTNSNVIFLLNDGQMLITYWTN